MIIFWGKDLDLILDTKRYRIFIGSMFNMLSMTLAFLLALLQKDNEVMSITPKVNE